MSQGYVSAFNGNRDGYQLPLALQEAGLLDAFVTDFYTASDDCFRKVVPKQLRNRTRLGLPRARAVLAKSAFAAQVIGRLVGVEGRKLYPVTDRMLATRAGQVARRGGSALFCYSGYLPSDLSGLGSPRIVFQYHPHAAYIRQVIGRDIERFPQFAQLYAKQNDITGSLDIAQQRDWERADYIVCASSVTKRSLEFAGCDPAKISVVPYGLDIGAENVVERPGGACEFLFVGQGIARKGLHHLLLAWKQACLPHARLTLICYTIEPQLAQLAQQANVRLLSRQSPEALIHAYRQSDVFVMPSLLEGFGLVYLEALSSGCFIIGSTETGLPDLQLGTDVATLIEGGDVDALSDALIHAATAKRNKNLDPITIAASARQWSWHRFRKTIGVLASDWLRPNFGHEEHAT